MLQEQKQSKSQALDQRFQSTAMATAQTRQAAAGSEQAHAATGATKAEPGAAAAVMGHWADDRLDGAANAKSEADKHKPRVEGVFASTVLTWLGEPPWQVATDKEERSQDRMKVLHCSLWAAKPPDWYQEAGPRNVGHKVVGPNFVNGGWNVLTNANGLYHCAYVDLGSGPAGSTATRPSMRGSSSSWRDCLAPSPS